MKEEKRHNLRKAISELPSHHSKRIHFNKLFNHGRYDLLPTYQAPYGLWVKIETKMDHNSGKRVNAKAVLIRIAAAVILMFAIGTGLIYLMKNSATVPGQITENKFERDSSGETDILTIYNPSLCSGNPDICLTPLFVELEQQ